MNYEQIMEKLAAVPQSVWVFTAVFNILLGLANCFFGYRIFKILIVLWGVVVGIILGGLGGLAAAGVGGGIVGAILGGGLLGFLAYVLFFVALFILGASLGAVLAALGLAVCGVVIPPVFLIVPAVLGGVLALVLQKIFIIVGTSFAGSASTVAGVMTLMGKGNELAGMFQSPPPASTFVNIYFPRIAGWFILAVIGILVQFSLTARKRSIKKKPDETPAPEK